MMVRFRDLPPWMAVAEVTLDGVLVSEICTGFDLGAGEVELLRLREDGRAYVELGEVAVEIRKGAVEVLPA